MKAKEQAFICIAGRGGNIIRVSVEVKEFLDIQGEKFFVHKDARGWKCSHLDTGFAIKKQAVRTKKELMDEIEKVRGMQPEKLAQAVAYSRQRLIDAGVVLP